MTDTEEVDLSRLRKSSLGSAAEWRSVCTVHHNVMLEGPRAVTEAVLPLLRPHLLAPAVWIRRPAPFELPTGEVGALILQDVGGLATEEQTRLLRWLDAAHRRTQIVSTTAHPLFALVVRGDFDGPLYYRLNVMLLRVQLRTRPRWHIQDAEPERASHRRPAVARQLI